MQRAVFLMGPTGAGKTRAALALAERFPFEIVSVDSALVYRGLDIGSAKPSPPERARVPHHLIDVCDPGERYSAARFRSDAIACMRAIAERGRAPLLVGGTGLYFRALEAGLAELPESVPAIRAELEQELARHGAPHLHARLSAVDAEAAARIAPNDPQRLVRALEVQRVTGRPMSQLWREREARPLAVAPLKLVLAPGDRGVLHRAIAQRFDDMLARGLVNEVRVLRRRGDLAPSLPALKSVGYREVWRYLDGELSHAQMRERGIVATRQLARRQLTWFRREAHTQWFESDVAGATDALAYAIAGGSIFKPGGSDPE